MGLEPMTSPLPRECSTTELHQHYYKFNVFLRDFKSTRRFAVSDVA